MVGILEALRISQTEVMVFNHSLKKRKDSQESSLIRLLFVAELEFPKILASRLPQNTSNLIKCKHWKYWKIKTTADPISWRPDISSVYCSDINLFLINYAWCKLCSKWLLLFENKSMSLTLQEKHCRNYYSR